MPIKTKIIKIYMMYSIKNCSIKNTANHTFIWHNCYVVIDQ